jgi:nicotinamidase/pyrazinamidase
MNPVRILDIGDMQNGFLEPDGRLSIPGAHEIIGPANAFLRKAAESRLFDHTFVIMDTHFSEAYAHTGESRQFPIHCEYGTRDWELSVDVSGLPNIRYLMKNRFSMWLERDGSGTFIHEPVRVAAFENLYRFVKDPLDPRNGVPRDEYLRGILPGGTGQAPEVVLFGVAADFCNRYAMEGWVARGARVTILGDLTRGIGKEWPEVLAEERYRSIGPGSVRVMTSREFLEESATHPRAA